jgi:DNA-binding transcriptional MerR regulator
MSAVAGERTYRIGEVAERLGVTPRTIRYYQELGLVHASAAHAKGTHRLFTEEDVVRLGDLIRLRDLLGLSLEELTLLIEAEEARAELRGRWAETRDEAERVRILESAIPHVERQLELVRTRRDTLDQLEVELVARLGELRSSLTARRPAKGRGRAQ